MDTYITNEQRSGSKFLDVALGDDDNGDTQPQQPASKMLHLQWTNLFKTVEIKDETSRSLRGSRVSKITPSTRKSTVSKVILDHISGEARPGEILATMGPSGSGKTSLMNVLSGRAAYQEGTICINGKPLDKAGMKKLMSRVAYVKQQDIFFESISVRDQLTYTAQLRFSDTNTTKEERNHKILTEVDKILDLLRLTKVADSPIMMCSGGEKKRVNIGTELLTNPAIILLDEPTSGLDSASAVSLLRVLKDLAKNHGKTIITSIHQPNSATFLHTFDKLLMLSDGNVVYFGTPGESLRYLKSRGLPCPEGYNAADHWMDLLVTDSTVEVQSSTDGRDWSHKSKSHKSSDSIQRSPKFYLQSIWDNDAAALRLSGASKLRFDTTDNNLETNIDDIDHFDENKYATSWVTQYKTLTHRALMKNKMTVFSTVNIVKTIATGIAVGIVYFNQRYTESDVYNIYAYFFFVTLYWVFDSLFAALFSFPQERIVVLKERATASYRLSAYFCAMTTADLPVRLFMPFLFLIISYWMAVPTLRVSIFLLILPIALLSVVTGQGIGQMLGAAYDDIQVAQAVATVLVVLLMLLGGFFARNIPIWLSWVRYISPFAYASNAALGVIFWEPIPCDGSGALGAMCENEEGFADYELVKDSFSVYGTVLFNCWCLVATCILPRLLAYWFLRRKKPGERE